MLNGNAVKPDRLEWRNRYHDSVFNYVYRVLVECIGETHLAEVKVLQGYRVTIPEEVRRRLKIKRGDALSWEMRGREVVFRANHLPASPTMAMMGLATGTENGLEQAILEEVGGKLERSSKISRRKHFR